MKRMSVIVPMYNEQQHIARTLKSVRHAATVAGIECELIVVDNGSRDQGPQLAKEQGAVVLDCPGISIGALRNRGAEAATGEWLAFIDADIEVPPNWLQVWTSILESGRADVVALDCNTPCTAPWFARVWQRRSRSGAKPDRLLQWLPTTNLCLERAWFARIGGFDETLRTGEDKDFGLRLSQAGARQLSLSSPMAQNWGFEGNWREWIGKELWRQSSHLQLLKKNSTSLRLLRFPLLCMATALMSVLAVLCLLLGQWLGAGLALLLGGCVPTVLALRQSYRHLDLWFFLQLWPLHWLRLHLGAAALLQSLFNQTAVRPDRG